MTAQLRVCIDGGGSKTAVQILDHQAASVSFVYQSTAVHQVELEGCNINVDPGKVTSIFGTIFTQFYVNSRSIADFPFNFMVIAGVTGLANQENRAKVAAIFSTYGVSNFVLMGDAEMALKLVPYRGAIVIAGTGSVSFGKNSGQDFRVGGLGPVFGEAGSGYAIGLKATEAALAQAFGWGEETALTTVVKDHYAVEDIKGLTGPLNRREITPRQIAALTPKVIEAAGKSDQIAQKVVSEAACDIASLLAKMVAMAKLTDCKIHLWGGLFRSSYSDKFQQVMSEHSAIQGKGITFLNRSHENVAVLYAQEKGSLLCQG